MFSSFKSIWHAVTSNDRHSNYDSPYRTGQHVPLNAGSGRMSTLAAVATASESRQDVSSPYSDSYFAPGRTSGPGAGVNSPGVSTNAANQQLPYSPGARSESARRQSQMANGFDTQSPAGEIPMQSFQDGLPPPPPVSHSWRRIDRWADENYPELFDQLCEGATTNDLNELEHMLDCSLPMDVRESLQIHDGQERGGNPTGIIFGSMLLDCEEMVQEWDNWRTVQTEFLSAEAAAASAARARSEAAAARAAAAAAAAAAAQPADSNGASASGSAAGSVAGSVAGSIAGNDEASSSKSAPASRRNNPTWRQDLQSRQDSIPAGAVQKTYAHPAWIPLVRDWGGNNLAVDLAPGPRGQWGQVILFGRDYDTKYVVARSWAAFLALVADDLNSGKWYIDEETKELKLREFKTTRVEPPYFDILRWRMDQKYGRRVVKRRSGMPGAAGSPMSSGPNSPYTSPIEPTGPDRGRPLQRLSLNSPLTSPSRPGVGSKPSPLARVTEETSLSADSTSGKLVEVDAKTPIGSSADTGDVNNENAQLSSNNAGRKPAAVEEAEDAMKTIEI